MRFQRWSLVAAAVVAAGIVVAVAEDDEDENYEATIKALPTAKHTLADGIRDSSKAGAVPLSAKFELGDEGDAKGSTPARYRHGICPVDRFSRCIVPAAHGNLVCSARSVSTRLSTPAVRAVH